MIQLQMANDDIPMQLELLHDQIDRRANAVARQNRERLQCRRGCADCCIDDLTVFEVEASRIVNAHSVLLQEGSPHPAGACAFLDAKGACRIYAERPYVCRTQGLPLRWFESGAGEVTEVRDICELNVSGAPIEELPESACWEIGPTESELAMLQRALDGGAGRRVSLRSLFESVPGDRHPDADQEA
jgi:Fe-S-cluster containining protein